MSKNGKARTTIEVVIVDDHPIIRCGLKGLLAGDHVLKVVGEADTGAKAIALISRLQPDVALMDIRLGLMSGIEVIRCAKQLSPATKILVLSAYDDVQYVRSMIKLGVNGYLLKTASADEVRRAIQYVAEGGLIFQPQIACKAISVFEGRSDAPFSSRDTLTRRENEVLSHIAQGLRDKEIASLMGIVPK
ncbi:MAG: response regulator transcription factor, partial [Chloroflexota bacterium]